jgi:glutamate-1-semialdehyde 2,1-aminomutase
MKGYEFKRSLEMFEHAQGIIPTGIPGPLNPNFYKLGSYPCFYERGQGSHVWDVDGNEYIDYMCGFGPIILGINHPKVEESVRDQMLRGNLMTFPSDKWVELADYLVANIPVAEWVMFGKNGSDVTTVATRIARVHTGRNGIIMAHSAYHGFHYWCTENLAGIPDDHRRHNYHFEYNDLEDLERVVKDHSGDLAGIILCPLRHDFARDQELPAAGFFDGVRSLCDKEGMVFIMDDVRCGFRIRFEGSHEYFGADPDIVCFGKAISNGYPLSVAVGKNDLMNSASQIMFIATHFFGAVPMAAALACLDEIKSSGAIEKIEKLGLRLKQGMEDQARAAGVGIHYTGHPAMPYMTFEDDPSFEKAREFGGEAARRGVIFHPLHNWFISAAHTEDDIDRTIEVAFECFRLIKEKY